MNPTVLGRSSFVVALITIILLSGCGVDTEIITTTTANSAPQTSLWGSIQTISTGPVWDIPQFATSDDIIQPIWIDPTASEFYFSAGDSSAEVMEISVNQPQNLTVIQGVGSSNHLLWLDSENQEDNRLFAALYDTNLGVIRGELPISDKPTYTYTAVENGDGTIWVIWSGGIRPELALYIQTIDTNGRFRIPEYLIGDAQSPTFTRHTNGQIILYWIRSSTRHVYRSILENGQIVNNQNLGFRIVPPTGAYLANFHAASDRTHDYLIWSYSDGISTTSWYSSSPRDVQSWQNPHQFILSPIDGEIETGFNTGSATGAEQSDMGINISWVNALPGEHDTVAVSGQSENSIVVVYLKEGGIHGYQNLLTAINTPSAQFSTLIDDRNRHLYLLWSETDPSTSTNTLKLTTTRQ